MNMDTCGAQLPHMKSTIRCPFVFLSTWKVWHSVSQCTVAQRFLKQKTLNDAQIVHFSAFCVRTERFVAFLCVLCLRPLTYTSDNCWSSHSSIPLSKAICLFVTLTSSGQCVPWLHSLYNRKSAWWGGVHGLCFKAFGPRCGNYGFLGYFCILNYQKLWIFSTMHLFVTFLVSLESSLPRRVHRLCFMTFSPMVWKLLNFKAFMN